MKRLANMAAALRRRDEVDIRFDAALLGATVVLCLLGLVMLTSASLAVAEHQYGDPLAVLKRQGLYFAVGALAATTAYATAPEFWIARGRLLLAAAAVLLILTLLPGLGRELNGSRRWIVLGGVSIQSSEIMKLAMLCYLAGYIERHRAALAATFWSFLKPMLVVAFVSLLLLLEPDLGAAVIIGAAALGVLFLAGAKLRHLLLFGSAAAALAALAAVTASYRWARLQSFMDPWSDPVGGGYQLTQSLIAVGGGSWFGRGLGESVQKLFYLPEVHSDFVFAVIAEELGFVGVCAVVALYWLLVWRCLKVAERALHVDWTAGFCFAGGVGVWLGLQAFVNIAVVLGALPTKGLTLPLVSAGGSSLVVTLVALAMVQRVHQRACARDQGLMRFVMRRRGDAVQ